MSRALKIILGVEIVLGVLWTVAAAMATGSGGLAVVGLLFVVYSVFAAFFLVALWAFWKYPDERRRAGWIMALPIVFWFLPTMVRSLSGGVLTGQQFGLLLAFLGIAALLTCLVAPRKAIAAVPTALLRSRLFNALVFFAVVLGWLFLVFVVAWVASGGESSAYKGDTGYGLAYAIVLGAIYLVGLGIGSLLAMAWAWLGLRGGVDGVPRKWHIAQLVIAVPGVALGAIVFSWLAAQGIG